MLRAFATGLAVGMTLFVLGVLAFVKGCPILDRDTVQPF